MLKRIALSLWLLGVFMAKVSGQTFPFARLVGNPVDTAGWFFAGDARVGDTPGDIDSDSDEVILCPPNNFRSGAVFFKTPINIASCQKWTAEFDFRMFDGSGADGIAFFFLNNPPQSYINGGGMGIPPRPLGLLVGLDSYQNCNAANTGPVPKLQIRYGNGETNYSECPSPPQPTVSGFDALRAGTYNRLKIDYDAGNIAVFVNDTLRLNGFYNINFAGYFGLTASTGGSTDLHSIKNFSLYTQRPIFQAPNAGADRIICRNGIAQLGDANQSPDYIYKWYPTAGLSDSTAPNPSIQLANEGTVPFKVKYFVSKDTLGGEPRCAFADDVEITVLPTLIQGQKQYSICSNTPTALAMQGVAGVNYQWTPGQFFNNPNTANPSFFSLNTDSADLWINVRLTATHPAGCTEVDTIRFHRLGRFAQAGSDLKICGSDTVRMGIPARPGLNYSWFRITPNIPSLLSQIEDNQASQTRIALTASDTVPKAVLFRLLVLRTDLNCRNDDTVAVWVFPKLNPINLPAVSICAGDTALIGSAGKPALQYSWQPVTGLSQPNGAESSLTGLSLSQTTDTTYFRIKAWDEMPSCFATDSVRIRFKQAPVFQAISDKAICPGDSIFLGEGRQFPQHYLHAWQPATYLLQPDSAATWFFAPGLSDTLFTYIQNHTLEGCLASDTLTIQIRKRPGYTGLPFFKACSDSPLVLGGQALPHMQYVWQPAVGLSSDTVANPVLNLTYSNLNAGQSLNYTLSSTDKITACRRQDSVKITLQPSPEINMNRSLNLCSGDTLQVGPAAADSLIYNWQFHPGLSDTAISSPTFTARTLQTRIQKLELTVRSLQTSCTTRDSVFLAIHPLPRPARPAGPSLLCGLDSIRTYVPSLPPDSTWQISWQVNNGQIISNAPAGLQVRWLAFSGNAVSIKVQDTLGCQGQSDTLVVNAVPLPTGSISGPDFLCPDRFAGVPYSFNGASASLWVLSGARSFTQSSNQIAADFDSLANGFSIKVIPVSAEGCRGDTVKKILNIDRFFPVLHAVSVESPGKVALALSGLQNRSGLSLSYGSELENSQAIAGSESLFLEALDTQQPLRFQVTGKDRCNIERKSEIHRLLTGQAIAEVGSASVSINTIWSAYERDVPIDYELFLENPSPVRKLAEGPATSYLFSNYQETTHPAFRVRASWTKDGKDWESWSDVFSARFALPEVRIPNLITPNGDGQNDVFEIPYLYFFSRAELEMVDRWGKIIYSSGSYQNDWDAAQVLGGVYFYKLNLDGKQINGWLRVEK